MSSENMTEAEPARVAAPQPTRPVDDQLSDELVSRAQAEDLQLIAVGGVGRTHATHSKFPQNPMEMLN